jgi:hypothetical protein
MMFSYILLVRIAQSLVFCVEFCKSLFVLFRLAIVLSVLRFTDADYPFGIYKLFFKCKLAGILKFILETCLQAVETLGFHINQETYGDANSSRTSGLNPTFMGAYCLGYFSIVFCW